MNAEHDQLRPSARTEGIVVQALPDEVLVYDLERHKAHCLNRTAALIWKQCNGQTSVTEMICILEQELKTPVPEGVVWLALRQLGRAHLLAERVDRSAGQAMMSRRAVIRRLGWGAALTLPLVTSIVAPTAVEAATCLPSLSPCTSGAQCCSGLCVSFFCV
ncbi:MAG TPA: PqqD family protein [Candidatus Tectomicrobia bacterium]|nr:PqqD family protein [Candidatus Tectomicrobia bacterium]